ncbi:hypothetical protein M422DRAFT_53159 [Sphaerobolus stellatus SS14]|uniref:Uncharacterized protein n=1 Tax=Sphaerobolus stellatus (strain SS14) TaxID=990650 RepID=A0A0C9V358_SPHS4|nr:hypothetical protein M422DRAFT_53159 [Sphaerobolus stellatus SS14]
MSSVAPSVTPSVVLATTEAFEEPHAIRLIIKPLGSIGNPNHGSYTLHTVLSSWSDTLYADVQLDLSKTFAVQDESVIKEICDDARIEFPVLADYDNDWPARDFLYSYHKTVSTKTWNRRA